MHSFRIWSTLCTVVAFTVPASAQQPQGTDPGRLQRLLAAEDARGGGSDSIKPLTAEASARDPVLRRVAVRGLGRLQRPDFIPLLSAALADSLPMFRIVAANAMAQSVSRVRLRSNDAGQDQVRTAARALVSALAVERNDSVADAIAESLGRLPYADSIDVRGVERAILDRARSGVSFDVARGLYHLALDRRVSGGLSPRAIGMLRDAAHPPRDAAARRVAVLALTQQGALDSLTLLAAAADPDEQLRRLALAGIAVLAPASRKAVVRSALADANPIVRVAAIAAARVGATAPDCEPISTATADRSDYVALTAIDALGLPCAERSAAASVLMDIITRPRDESIPDHAWQRAAHALVALAHIDSALVAPYLARFAGAPRWQERKAGAVAAASARDIGWLRRLTGDADNNVRAAAIDGLAHTARHAADSVYIAALAAHGNQVVLSAAQALAGSAAPEALPRLLDAFDSLSTTRTENARDPRIELLKRIGERGGPGTAARLSRYLADFDTTIAANAAALLSQWSGTVVRATPQPLPIRSESLAAVYLARDIRLRVTVAASSGGGTFTIKLFPDEAPATVARIIRLARAHYYDGHVFQRVEPDFVIQGGGPDASEYVGDSTFMRDELTSRSHLRGTLGISTRGRDTGDAQWFINLADNTRLDHEYTVFGAVIAGRGTVEQILEGDVIGRVEVLP